MKHHFVQYVALGSVINWDLISQPEKYWSKIYACITSTTFVFLLIFQPIVKLWLCWHACQREDKNILTCLLEKSLLTMALNLPIKVCKWRSNFKSEYGFVQGTFFNLANLYSLWHVMLLILQHMCAGKLMLKQVISPELV